MFPSYLAEHSLNPPIDLRFTIDALTDRMRSDFGLGRRRDVTVALEFLRVARLATEEPHSWQIHFRDLGTIDRDIAQALLHEYRSTANKARPIRTAQKAPAPVQEESIQPGLFDEM